MRLVEAKQTITNTRENSRTLHISRRGLLLVTSKMGAVARRLVLVVVCVLLALCPEPTEGERPPRLDPNNEIQGFLKHGGHPANLRPYHDSPPCPPSHDPHYSSRAGQLLTKTLSRGIKKAWRERRVSADTGEPPLGWFQRAFDWMDGRVVSDETSKHETTGDSFDPFDETLDTKQSEGNAASWETREAVSSDGQLDEEKTDGTSAQTAFATPLAKKTNHVRYSDTQKDKDPSPDPESSSSETHTRAEPEEAKPHPLADRTRKPDFVFTMGGDEQKKTGWGASADQDVDFGKTQNSLLAYQREKRSKPIGDAVSDLTQRDAAAQAAARQRAEQEKKARGVGSFVAAAKTEDVRTDITVLTHENFDNAVRFAKRLSDGIGLGVSGGLPGERSGGDTSDDSKHTQNEKRKWLIAFCTRWSPLCNLLVREFALLGSDRSLKDFALGWVDCTPAAMTSFCGVRFGAVVEGYPTVVLITGGRVVRYRAVDKERIAGAMAPWARRTADAVDGHAPNSGEKPPGVLLPENFGAPSAPAVGAKGTHAHGESEFDALRKARERKIKERERIETRRAAEERRKQKNEADRPKKKAEQGTTTAPKKSKRRVAREAAETRRKQSSEL